MKRLGLFVFVIALASGLMAGCDTLGSNGGGTGKVGNIVGPDPITSIPTVVSFAAEPTTVKLGSTSTLRWDTINAISANITASVGPNLGSVPISGSRVVTFSSVGTVTFTLTIVGSDGRQITSFASVVVTP